MDNIDPKRLWYSKIPKARNQPCEKPPRHKPGERFLKGPIPWKWLMQAGHLGGKALHVAICLWYLAGMSNKRTVKLSGTICRECGVKRHASYRGLKALEDASLVTVDRKAGCNPVVSILNV